MKKIFTSIPAFLFFVPAFGDDAPAAQARAVYKEIAQDPWFYRHGVIILLLLLFLLAFVAMKRRRRHIEIFSSETGRVHVSRGALEDLVENAALQYGAVSRPRARFEKRRGKLHLYVRLKLGPGQKLPQFSSGLQAHLSRSLRDAFGIEGLGGVNIIITGFKGGAFDVDAPAATGPTVPYHGAGPEKAPARARQEREFFET